MADLNTEWFMEPSVRANYRTMVYYPGAGQDTFDINFEGGYINRSDVKAFMVKDDTRDRVNLAVTFVGGSTSRIKVSQVVPKGWTVCIFRDTPKAKPLAQFTDGAIINEKNLDRNAQQAMFAVSEMVDRFDSTVDSVDSALLQVYEANNKSDEAIRIANGAVTTANGAVTKADVAINKADSAISIASSASSKAEGASITSEEAKSIAQGLDAQIKEANATSAKAVETADTAKSTAGNALSVANGVDAKATQALNNSTTALNTANGIDAKATQAQQDAKEALDKANTAINTGNVASNLTDRVESFPSSTDVKWKGKHTFQAVTSTNTSVPTYKLEVVPKNTGGTINFFDGSTWSSLVLSTDGDLKFGGYSVLRNGSVSPLFKTRATVESTSNPGIWFNTTGGVPYRCVVEELGSTGFGFTFYDGGTRQGAFVIRRQVGVTNYAASESYVKQFVDTRGDYNFIKSKQSKVELRLDDTSRFVDTWTSGRLINRIGPNYSSAYSDSDYCGLRAYRADNSYITLETSPYKGTATFGNIINSDTNGNVSVLRLPNKNGTLAITSEHYTRQEVDGLLAQAGKSSVIGYKFIGNNDGNTGGVDFKYITSTITIKSLPYTTMVRLDLSYRMFRQRDIVDNTSISVSGTAEMYRADAVNGGQTRQGSGIYWTEVPANTAKSITVTLGVRAVDGNRSQVTGSYLISRAELNTSTNMEI